MEYFGSEAECLEKYDNSLRDVQFLNFEINEFYYFFYASSFKIYNLSSQLQIKIKAASKAIKQFFLAFIRISSIAVRCFTKSPNFLRKCLILSLKIMSLRNNLFQIFPESQNSCFFFESKITKIIISPQMNTLKSVLSSQSGPSPSRDKNQANNSLLKGVNKSKSQTLWSLDIDNNDRVTQQSMDTDSLLKLLNDKLQFAFKKQSKSISEITFERIVQQFQDDAGGNKSELSYLLLMEDKISDMLQFSREDFKAFLEMFNKMLEAKVARLRKKEKKTELNQFDNIVNVNFKKKTEDKGYLKVQQSKPIRKSREKQIHSRSPRKASGSTDNKLNRLFSKQKNPLKQRQMKQSLRKGQQQGGFNQTANNNNNDESISFSSVLATTVTVKSRRRKDSTDYKKQKPKKTQEKASEKDEGDEAFIFFRPKKNKK